MEKHEILYHFSSKDSIFSNIFAPDLIFKDNANSFKFIGSVWEKSFVR
ncbi:hypothetical protein CCAND38_80022 [Capnocytophaga canis]|uniref:Uncharacterized protein n=1 Tax=Capnocytophaga canis TaxID=1848903 RepID=A0A0B7IBX9_9FLAO|nr:hypothetical protein CCAND38_80022 [Capnocytophaga canis]CEN52015.1 hypothetical protein CCAND93_20089 [Capnocytophaga canis]